MNSTYRCLFRRRLNVDCAGRVGGRLAMYDVIAFMWLFSIVALILGFMYLVIRLTNRGERNGEP